MTDTDTINEITKKMDHMNKLLESNLFNNPIRETNESLRKELLEFREIFFRDLNNFDKYLVNIFYNLFSRKKIPL